ncbi:MULTISPECIES: hypothetical protein [unclassified Marinovum]
MAVIAKIDPPLTVAKGETAQIHARPYKAADAHVGEEIFVWTSEMSGGHNLAARGTVVASRIETMPNPSGPGEHKELVLDVEITAAAPTRALSLDQIFSRSDGVRKTPKPAAGRVFYTHTLNKIASIEPDVADFVRSHFEEH